MESGPPASTKELDDPDGDIQSIAVIPSEIPSASDGLDSPSLYADMIRGAYVSPDITKFNLVEVKMDGTNQELKAVPVATIVLPSVQLRAWGEFFIRLADQHKLPPIDVN